MLTSLRTVTPFLVLSLIACTGGTSDLTSSPPPTRVETVVDTFDGVEIPDDYRWLEDQESPEARAWIEAQNSYTSAALASRPERPAIQRRFEKLSLIPPASW